MANTPKIRFKGFTDAWEQRKLGDVIEKLTGGASIAPDDYTEQGYRTIPKGAVNETGIADMSGCKYVTREFFEKNISNKVLAGELVTSLRDLVPTAPNMGRIVRICGDYENFLMPQGVYSIVVKEKVSEDFLITYSNSPAYRKVITSEKNGSTQVHIRNGDFLNIDIPLPSYDEQKKIGDYFRNFDNLIFLYRHKCDEIKELKKYMLKKMFPQDGKKVPEIRFAGFTEDWERRKLGEICESFEYGLNAAAKEYDGENKYIRITDIDDSSHNFIQKDVTSPDVNLENADEYKLNYGDLLFARTGASVGKTYIYKESDGLVYYAGFLIRGRVKKNYSPEFVFQNTLTEGYDKFIRITSQRSGQPGVNAQEYARYEISVPVIGEQEKIGAYFSNLDTLITLYQHRCDELKEVRKFMLQNVFL